MLCLCEPAFPGRRTPARCAGPGHRAGRAPGHREPGGTRGPECAGQWRQGGLARVLPRGHERGCGRAAPRRAGGRPRGERGKRFMVQVIATLYNSIQTQLEDTDTRSFNMLAGQISV